MSDHRIELLEQLANVALTRDEFTTGLELRVKSTFGKAEMRKLLADLTPRYVEVSGEFPDDHYRIKARGVLKTSRRVFFLTAAADFRQFIIELHDRDPNFRSFSWRDVTEWLKRTSRELQISVEGARFTFTFIGAWGGGGSGDGWTWMRPLAEMLELIVDPSGTDLPTLINQAELFLHRSTTPYSSLVEPPVLDVAETGPQYRPEPSPGDARSKVFIVHGRNHVIRDVIDLLVTKQGLETVVMDAGPHKGRSLTEKFEQMARECAFAICIWSADDELTLHGKGGEERVWRARQNAILEAGYFWGLLGRFEKIAILADQRIEMPSDIMSLGYIRITEDLVETKAKLLDELRGAKLIQ